MDLSAYGISDAEVLVNLWPAQLYEHALRYDGGELTSRGALATRSGKRTGRSPKDRRIVLDEGTRHEVWWGPVNQPLSPEAFDKNRIQAAEFLNRQPRVYVVDGYAGADPTRRLKVRVICSRPYHALFMRNMLIRPTRAELAEFGAPDFVILNAGQCPADSSLESVDSDTSIGLDFSRREMVILGTEYAGEMKKGIFTVMNYWMPAQDVLSMHCSANQDATGAVTLFFGLSGTGKTTLSADSRRRLIGDDEHCWTDQGVFNIEGGCYAKCIDLNPKREPEIYGAIRFGAVLENTVQDPTSREVDFGDARITQNTRAAYPIEFIDNAAIPSCGGHPKHVILLTCDAFGVLPPVARLTPEQAMYHFINGYTAKVAGAEMGVTEPQATFSACFGAAFLARHPTVYARMLADKIQRHQTNVWLVNTGWTCGGYGHGQRISLRYTRAIIDAIHGGTLENVPVTADPIFGLAMPDRVPGCPREILTPHLAWPNRMAYFQAAQRLAERFIANFSAYADAASPAVRAAAPTLPAVALLSAKSIQSPRPPRAA